MLRVTHSNLKCMTVWELNANSLFKYNNYYMSSLAYINFKENTLPHD